MIYRMLHKINRIDSYIGKNGKNFPAVVNIQNLIQF